MPFSQKSQTILVVEDNDDDYSAIERALKRNKNFRNPLVRCHDGQEAVDYLFGYAEYAPPNKPDLPGLVLLDLNMPGLDGHGVLKRMRTDPRINRIPVVVMTTSDAPEDVNACYDAGANTYVQKPVSWTEFCEAVTRLQEYWFEIAILPKHD